MAAINSNRLPSLQSTSTPLSGHSASYQCFNDLLIVLSLCHFWLPQLRIRFPLAKQCSIFLWNVDHNDSSAVTGTRNLSYQLSNWNWLDICNYLSAAESTTFNLSGTQRSAMDKLCNGCKVEDQQDDLQHGSLPVNCQAYRVVSHTNGLP